MLLIMIEIYGGIPYEKDANVMVKAYQKFWSAYHKDRSHRGATLIKDMERLHTSRGWSCPIPKADIGVFNERGEKEEYEGWRTAKFVLRRQNEWNENAVYIPSIAGPITSFHPIYGLRFSIGPDIGSTDSCATFEVGPIYLR